MNQSFDAPLDSNDADSTYKVLRDSVLHVYQFATKIAKDTNPDNELRVGWDLGDKSLINWISDTHCYLIRRGQKIQFLARPSKLEIISFSLHEGDRLLICSDNLRNILTETRVDLLVQSSANADDAVKSLEKAYSSEATAAAVGNIGNIIVMEVINNRKEINTSTKAPQATKAVNEEVVFSAKKAALWLGLPLLSLMIGAGGYLLYDKTDKFQGLFSGGASPIVDDTLSFLGKDSSTVTVDTIKTSSERAARQLQDSLANVAVLAQAKQEEVLNHIGSSSNEEKKTTHTRKEHAVKTNSEYKPVENAVVSTSESPKKSVSTDAEKQNYDALLLQRDKWTAVVDDLKVEQANGNNTVSEKLTRAQQVLFRVNQKISESSKKLGY